MAASSTATTPPASTSAIIKLNSNTAPSSSSFVGNTPSTVLFVLAMAVGVAIACLFIFFTVRYFVRARFGLHLYAASNRGLMFSPRVSANFTPVAYTDREILEHLEYLRTHHFLRNDFLERRLYAATGLRRRRRRRRRGRFARMKKLSPDEVEKLFPRCRYVDWLSSGDDSASSISVDVAKGDGLAAPATVVVAARSQASTAVESDFGVVEMHESPAIAALATEPSDVLSLSALLKAKHDLHFDSGTCSICLEIYELDDIVRGLICGHVFHAECVDPWLTRRRACCPICKRDYYRQQGHSDAAAGGTVNIEERLISDNAANEADENDGGNGDSHSATAGPGEASPNAASSSEALRDLSASPPPHGSYVAQFAQDQTPAQSSPTANANSESGVAGERSSGGIERNTSSAEDGRDTRSSDEIDYEVIRADTNIQALFNELVPLSERVRVLLDEYLGHGMDARARTISTKKYGSVLKRFFWRLMGISKQDLYNWAVIKIYQDEIVSQSNNSASGAGEDGHSGLGPANPTVASNATPQLHRAEEVEMADIPASTLVAGFHASAAASAYPNAEEDVELDSGRRASVAERV